MYKMKELNLIFDKLAKELDISRTQHETIVTSYNAIGELLSGEGSLLKPYSPAIKPQGSLVLGTMVKPISDFDDIDIDLVCQLEGKDISWTQEDIKQIVGDRIRENESYRKMLAKEGRRCWRLDYSESSNYHLDILPALISLGYHDVRTVDLAEFNDNNTNLEKLALRITDKLHIGYKIDPIPENWPKSNPFAYATWFYSCCHNNQRGVVNLSEVITPCPEYRENKLNLQKIVQILKRHRDIMFSGDEDKPISIIITTLAAKSYRGENSILDGLVNVCNSMENYIKTEMVDTGKLIKRIDSPVNAEENFADKWVDYPQREQNFYQWMAKLKSDINLILRTEGIDKIAVELKRCFGENVGNQCILKYGEMKRKERESQRLTMDLGTGVLSESHGIKVPNHKFYGNK